MVRLIRVERGGKVTWVEDAPTVCPAGHEGVQLPGTTACPRCRWSVRYWRCPTCLVEQYDDEHRCRE